MAEIIQRSFTSGEIAPSLRSRTDLNKYQSGLALCENFIVRAQGGVYSRPGTRYIGELGDSTKVGRLIPFSFSTEQTYILVFEHLKMRIIKDGGYILDGGSPYELVTTYTEAQLSRLKFTQSADVLTIVHPDHDPAAIRQSDQGLARASRPGGRGPLRTGCRGGRLFLRWQPARRPGRMRRWCLSRQ